MTSSTFGITGMEVLESVTDGVMVMDREWRITYVNAAAARLASMDRERMLGQDHWALFPGSRESELYERLASARSGQRSEFENFYAPWGRWFHIVAYPGTDNGVVLLYRDITSGKDIQARGEGSLADARERQRLEDALRRSEQRFRGIFESSAIGVAVLGRDGRTVEANQAFCALTGYSEAELAQRDILSLIDPADREVLRGAISQVLSEERRTETAEVRFRRPDGKIVWVQNGVSSMVDASGRPEGAILLSEDVSDRKAAQYAATLLSAIVDSSDDAIISKDLNGIITSWNPSAERLFGYRADEVVGKPITILIPPDRLAEEPQILKRLSRGERVDHFETVRRHKSGRRLNLSLTISPVKDSKGVIVGASKIARDITDRKSAERAALLLSAIVDSSDDAIISKDLTGIITSWNRSAERVFGYTAEEIVGRSVLILIPPDRQDEEPKILERLKRGERVDHFETIRRRKDGTLLNISLTISPIKSADGRIVGASKIARDITGQKRAEAALRDSEIRFRQLADAMPQMVWTARPDGTIDYYNERWYAFTGFSREGAGDQGWLPIQHPEDAPRSHEIWKDCIKNGSPYTVESRLWDRDAQRWRWFMVRALPAHNAAAEVVKWFGTCTDIDAQKSVEDEMRRANLDLQQFAYSASHDLQEPLRTVKIYTELLVNRYSAHLDRQGLEFCDYVREGASRMEMLVRDLLAYTQVTKLEAPVAKSDTNAALRDALAGLGSAISEKGAGVTSVPLPPVAVHHSHLRQLFQNLIGNAIKYAARHRPPAIHVDVERSGDVWAFSVRDNGIGIEPAYKEQIFGLFKRLHAGNEYPGTGIGLAICQRIVERYRGRIWVESKAGEGSTFFFTIPV